VVAAGRHDGVGREQRDADEDDDIGQDGLRGGV
jgi:hypothetical protein